MQTGKAFIKAEWVLSTDEEKFILKPMTSHCTGNDDAFSGGQEKDGLSLLNEILGSSSLEDGGFSQEWCEVFGEDDPDDGNRAETQLPEEEPAFFLPSTLLDQNMNDRQSTVSGQPLDRDRMKSQIDDTTIIDHYGTNYTLVFKSWIGKIFLTFFKLFLKVERLQNLKHCIYLIKNRKFLKYNYNLK